MLAGGFKRKTLNKRDTTAVASAKPRARQQLVQRLPRRGGIMKFRYGFPATRD